MTRAEFRAARSQYRAALRITKLQLESAQYADREYQQEVEGIWARAPIAPYTLPRDKLAVAQADRRRSVIRRVARRNQLRAKGMLCRTLQNLLRLTLVSVPVTPAPLPRWAARSTELRWAA